MPSKKCMRCFNTPKRTVGHHHNYANPLDVDWVGDRCHKAVHRYLDAIGWKDYVLPEPLPVNTIQPIDLKNVLNEDVKAILEPFIAKLNLNERQTEILRLRARRITMKDIGEIWHITQERVRQILLGIEKKYDFYKRISCN